VSDDEPLREVYARIMRQRDATGRADAVPVEQMQALLERRGSEQERVRTLDAIMRDQDTRADFEILRAAYEAAPARAASFPVPYAIAAALVVMVGSGLWLRSREPAVPDTSRGPVPTVAIVAPGPSAQAGAPLQFTWRRVTDAKAYSLQVVDTDGNVAYAAITSDTVATLPDTVRLVAEKEYRWWIEAERTTGAPIKSAVQTLRVIR
jgi:hypothetical protein